ncbi:MAG: FAD:protein FMN transferase [Ekhidna sp.]|nr:FAD:protein FMN transferase [Ekhidna sp.]
MKHDFFIIVENPRMNKRTLLVFGIGLILAFLIFTFVRSNSPQLRQLSGQTMGAIIYNVKYIGLLDDMLQTEVDSVLNAFNQSLSTYIPDSEISDLNNTGKLTFRSPYFYPVLAISKEIFNKTNGAFDPTVGPLINAWGFGPEEQIPDLDSVAVDSLLNMTGFEGLSFNEERATLQENYRLDFSAVAKGYAVDLIGELLEGKGIENYLVEIGGEVRCRGVNKENKSWSLGIEDPTVAIDERELLAIVRLKDFSLATSGNYRNYYEKDGRVYAHIIDPRTGYTTRHNLLSASVFASDCMTADAYATALMVLGPEVSQELVEREDIEAILVFQEEDGSLGSYVSTGIQPFVELNKVK